MAIPITTTGLPQPAEGISGTRRRSTPHRITKAIRTNRKATIGVFLMAVFIFVALFPGLLAHQDPNAITNHVFAHPSAAHWLGTDNLGRDVYAQVIDGTRNVLILALAVGLLTTVVAMLIGVAAAYLGGVWDSVLNFVTDVLLVIPIFPLLIIIAAYLPNAGNNVLILVLAFTGWSYTARQLRSQAQSLRNRDYLLAARVRGERPRYIIVVEILPVMTSLLLASFLNNALYAVLAGSGLQFIGIGNGNNVSWGTTLYWAQQNNALGSGLYVWAIVPGACIALMGAAFAFINYAFDEIGNPALRPLTAAKARKAAQASTKRRLGSYGARAR
ncbi:MAG TPA: ABC transporter permease [Streptosporangiaceae bacterium]|jgi:peptide/nickel transport system permease protein|nr:ABC transporter permease [Streptosporangiaceae bacterium]